MSSNDIYLRIDQLNAIGIALSNEPNNERLLEKILDGAQALTKADGGTLYLLEDDKLQFKILHNKSMGLYTAGEEIDALNLPPIPLHIADGSPNLKTVAANCALTGETVNIADIYNPDEAHAGFDFSGTLAYDKRTGYNSKAFLSVPMRNHEGDIIGVLQLINPTKDDEVVPFSRYDRHLVESLASQAAIALSNQRLVAELRLLLERFIEVIADAIDEKSPYTGGHCRRVPEVAMRLAEAINQHKDGPHAERRFCETELYELKIAALLHDCGKITTPIHVADKATKLETICDRMSLVEARYEILKRDLEISHLRAALEHHDTTPDSTPLEKELEQLNEELAFLRKINIGSEFMRPEDQQHLEELSHKRQFTINNHEHNLLEDDEILNLSISKGTLTDDERRMINRHIVITQQMLSSLPFPKHLQNVPEIAGNHHERMDGKGYPNGLTGDQMSLQARIMAIADIFEALTAADRPYKKAMPLSIALRILKSMSEEGHIDPEVYNVFIKQKVYLDYAEKFLNTEQIDI